MAFKRRIGVIRRSLTRLPILCLALLLPSPARAETLSFVAEMSGANGVPPVATDATGIAQIVLDTETLLFRFEVQLFDLEDFTMMHIHLGAAGQNGILLYVLSRRGQEVHVSGELMLLPIDIPDLMNGNLYVNAHTIRHPDGEIRGQLLPGDIRGRIIVHRQPLGPGNEVPPVEGLDAGALATLTLDLRLMDHRVVGGFALLDVEYRFPGDVLLTGLHVHRGPEGENGPIVIDSGLRTTADADGRGRIAFRIPAASIDGLETLQTIMDDPRAFYINLHSGTHPGGALRGQLHRGRSAR